MAVTAIDGELINLFASTDNGATWKKFVCEEDGSLEGSRNTTSRPTKCGILKAKGPVAWSMPFSGVANTTPETGEVSAQDVIEWFQNGTSLKFKFAHATDETKLYREGDGFLSGYTENYPAEDYVGFSGTVEIEGDLVLTVPS